MVGGRVAGVALAVLMLGGPQPPAADAGWRLVWHDEFNAQDGTRPDPMKWTHDVGGHGWGNRELRYYTERPANSEVRSGSLQLRAVKETYTGCGPRCTRTFTSARLHSMDRFAATYGRFEARMKLPDGRGLWSAFWLLGNDFKTIGWPGCGEIDILENVGDEPSTVHGTVHGPGYSHAAAITSMYILPAPRRSPLSTSTRLSGNRTRSASTSIAIIYRHPARPSTRHEMGVRSPLLRDPRTWPSAATGQVIRTPPRDSHRPWWWTTCVSTSGRHGKR